MAPDDEQPSPEREQTDESLRLEREKADADLDAKLAAIDEAADAVIEKARARADRVLAAARAKSDRQPRSAASLSSKSLEKERDQEDKVVRDERDRADQALRTERAEHPSPCSAEREETDKDLSRERARADEEVSARDVFLGIVSHDLRNMLSGMVGFATLIAKGVSRNDYEEQVVLYAQRIQRTGARMNRLIGDLVDVASIEAGVLAVKPEVADPALVVTEAVDAFQAQATASGVSLATEIVAPITLSAFDPARILQVLTNLLGNALKFTTANGEIVVRVEQAAEELRFTVRDTGSGIRHDMLEAIFERYLQATGNDRRGVGLGLFISRAIVQGHGGRIWAESKPGEGSDFCFTLPTSVAVA